MIKLLLLTALLMGCIVEPKPEFDITGEWCTDGTQCIDVTWFNVSYEDNIRPEKNGRIGKLEMLNIQGTFYYTHYNDTLEVEISKRNVFLMRK